MVPLDWIPIDFQNQILWGLLFLMLDQVEVTDVRHSPFTPSAKVPYFGDPLLIVGHRAWGRALGEIKSLPLFPSQWVSFIFCYGVTVHLVLNSFLEENYSMCSCKFVVFTRGGEFREFLCCRLELFPSKFNFSLLRVTLNSKNQPASQPTKQTKQPHHDKLRQRQQRKRKSFIF